MKISMKYECSFYDRKTGSFMKFLIFIFSYAPQDLKETLPMEEEMKIVKNLN